jgi:hypothetical protein
MGKQDIRINIQSLCSLESAHPNFATGINWYLLTQVPTGAQTKQNTNHHR